MKAHAVVLLALGLAAPLQGQAPPAADRAQQGLRHLEEAGKLAAQNRSDEALAELEKAYAFLPRSYDLSKLLGETYLRLNDPRAADILREAAELNPIDEAWENLSRALTGQGRCLDASQLFVERIKAEPRNALLQRLLGEAYSCQSRFEEALTQFKMATMLQPGSAPAHYWTAYMHYLLGQREEARRALETTLQLDAGFAPAQLTMGYIMADEGHTQKALPFFQAYLRQQPADVEARLKLAQILLDSDDHDAALHQLEEAKRLAPDEKRVYYLLNRLYRATNRPEEAKRALASFVALESSEARAKRTGNTPYLKR